MLDTQAFRAGGDEHFSAGDEHVANAHSNFSHTHTASYQRLPNRTYIELTSENVRFHGGEIRSYVDAHQHLSRPNLEYSRLEALVPQP